MRRLVIIPLLVFSVFLSQTPFAGPISSEETRAPDTPGPWRYHPFRCADGIHADLSWMMTF